MILCMGVGKVGNVVEMGGNGWKWVELGGIRWNLVEIRVKLGEFGCETWELVVQGLVSLRVWNIKV